jgi:hypothetical protein
MDQRIHSCGGNIGILLKIIVCGKKWTWITTFFPTNHKKMPKRLERGARNVSIHGEIKIGIKMIFYELRLLVNPIL